ncbi:MAG TPA: catalase [Kofleriaceae bacterium]|nr:catalase [Kofleriaceae bacterium]
MARPKSPASKKPVAKKSSAEPQSKNPPVAKRDAAPLDDDKAAAKAPRDDKAAAKAPRDNAKAPRDDKAAAKAPRDNARDKAAAKAASPALPPPKPPKPNPKPAQGPDGPTIDSVAKEGAEDGGGDDEHGSVGGGLFSRAAARVGKLFGSGRKTGAGADAKDGGPRGAKTGTNGNAERGGKASASIVDARNADGNGRTSKSDGGNGNGRTSKSDGRGGTAKSDGRGRNAGANGNGRSKSNGASNGPDRLPPSGETHQTATDEILTTNQGVPVSDDQNSLKLGARGPTLLEDFHFLEKMTHFDHERIPERIVHARGSAAHGTFTPYKSLSKLTSAAFLQNAGKETPVFVRFSTVAGGAGSVDLPRDVRGFAVKFYTDEGVFDLVGNNIPVFFIQDALKFPDLVHSVKMEPDRGYPQNATAHDTFWDFVSLMPESMHMLMWAMSDRTIPRSYRMMEGFGVHTFKLVNAQGDVTFVKWQWRPVIGSQSVVWDEAVKINGADQDFHRRDLFMAIQAGAFPEWELSIQAFTEDDIADFPFDILDATKFIPEELIPLQPIGKMVLDRWPDNFFAETEQVAFHPGHLVPGIDFTDDPLLQGRIFSYTDTQLKRLGSPNFHEIPINRPRCPMRNFQRDGHMRQEINRGRVNYEPNSLATSFPRETPDGFVTSPASFAPPSGFGQAAKVRERSETFADHYSQARQFWHSMTEPEQRHIVNAFTFELAKVDTLAIRTRMLGHLNIIEPELGARVADGLGMVGQAEAITPVREPIDLEPSPSLSILAKHVPTLQGRKVGCMIGDGFDRALVEKLRAAVVKEGAMFELVAPKIGGALAADGTQMPADHMILGAPSVLFDAVVVAPGAAALPTLMIESAAKQWVFDAFTHCKVIGVVGAAQPLLDAAGVMPDDGIVAITGKSLDAYVARVKQGRIWTREVITMGPDKKLSTSKTPVLTSGKPRYAPEDDMAKAAKPKKKTPPPPPPAKAGKPKSGGKAAGGPQMGIGDFMQEQFEERAGKKPKRG